MSNTLKPNVQLSGTCDMSFILALCWFVVNPTTGETVRLGSHLMLAIRSTDALWQSQLQWLFKWPFAVLPSALTII